MLDSPSAYQLALFKASQVSHTMSACHLLLARCFLFPMPPAIYPSDHNPHHQPRAKWRVPSPINDEPNSLPKVPRTWSSWVIRETASVYQAYLRSKVPSPWQSASVYIYGSMIRRRVLCGDQNGSFPEFLFQGSLELKLSTILWISSFQCLERANRKEKGEVVPEVPRFPPYWSVMRRIRGMAAARTRPYQRRCMGSPSVFEFKFWDPISKMQILLAWSFSETCESELA